MNDKQTQQAFMKWFSLKAQQAGKDPLVLALELGEDGLKQAYLLFIKEMKGIKAQLGAKLEYIQHLTAPKFACGGKTKKKKCQDGEKLDPILEYKCGRKMKRKMTEGGLTPKKTIKIKKPIDKKPVNPNDTINLPQGPRSLTDKEKRYPRLTKAEYRKLSRSKQADVDLKDSASGRSVN